MELCLPHGLAHRHAQIHHYCKICRNRNVKLYMCQSCNIGVYCSTKCQKSDIIDHATVCIGARPKRKKRKVLFEPESPLELLPNEIFENILQYLDINDFKTWRILSYTLEELGTRKLLKKSIIKLTDKSVLKLNEIRRILPYIKNVVYDIPEAGYWKKFPSLIWIKFTDKFNKSIRNLPLSVKDVIIENEDYEYPYLGLPDSVTNLEVHCNIELNTLPDSIIRIDLKGTFNNPIYTLPPQIKVLLITSEFFNQPIILGNNYPDFVGLSLKSAQFDSVLQIPEITSIAYLDIEEFNQPFSFENVIIKDLVFISKEYTQPLEYFPKTLESLILDIPSYRGPVFLPDSITYLSLVVYYPDVVNLPTHLKELHVVDDEDFGYFEFEVPDNVIVFRENDDDEDE